MVLYCFVKGCKSVKYKKTSNVDKENDKSIPFYGFPSDPELRKKWINALVTYNHQKNAEQLPKYSRICIKHFSQNCIEQFGFQSVRLKRHSVPSIFPCSSAEDDKESADTENNEALIQQGATIFIVRNVESVTTFTSCNDEKIIINNQEGVDPSMKIPNQEGDGPSMKVRNQEKGDCPSMKVPNQERGDDPSLKILSQEGDGLSMMIPNQEKEDSSSTKIPNDEGDGPSMEVPNQEKGDSPSMKVPNQEKGDSPSMEVLRQENIVTMPKKNTFTVRYPGDITKNRIKDMTPETLESSIYLLQQTYDKKMKLIKRFQMQDSHQRKKIKRFSGLLTDLRKNGLISSDAYKVLQVFLLSRHSIKMSRTS
ncbi:uncharacterized protein LOC105704286 [Orussus abietinus]|uniref:uncharacterized protein LOC105704286 n=1 Tax=Orussus abietinus TaxID=222816 RepID=UPI000625E261|nr:uncharacterized protein LOC105704286 [Orussus abietinus]